MNRLERLQPVHARSAYRSEAPLSDQTATPASPLGVVSYLLALLAFLPGIGALLGIPLVGWGLFNISRGGLRVAAIAGVGVTLNILGYLFWYLPLQRS